MRADIQCATMSGLSETDMEGITDVAMSAVMFCWAQMGQISRAAQPRSGRI